MRHHFSEPALAKERPQVPVFLRRELACGAEGPQPPRCIVTEDRQVLIIVSLGDDISAYR
jgi:hypothetical protein